MLRNPVHVRDAEPADATSLVLMWREDAGADSTGRTVLPDQSSAERGIARLALDPEQRLLVGMLGDEVVGMVQLTREPVSPIHDETTVRVGHMFVRSDARRRGVGRALLAAAVGWAEEKESTCVLATVPAASRDANRFLARLGLTQVANVRGATVGGAPERAGVQKRMAHLDVPTRVVGRLATVRRRTLRRRLASQAHRTEEE